jgi:excisionase family DNA binding protein
LARLVVFGEPGDPRKWVICANGIAARIADGRYPPGEWLPPIAKINADLGNITGTNYIPIQRALDEIRTCGLISFAENAGYYTGDSEPSRRPQGSLKRYVDAAGYRHNENMKRQQDAMRSGPYWTVAELAAHVRTSPMTIYRLIKEDRFDGVIQVRGSFRLPEASVKAFLATCRIDPAEIDLENLNDDEGEPED